MGSLIRLSSDRKISVDADNDGIIDYFSTDVLSYTDYYVFGSPMPGRNYNSPNYRYGFNGQEKDDEIAGNGNINTAEFWEYDTRLGRRWNRDPIVKPWESPYMCFSNNPIYFADPRGLTSSTVTPSGGGSKEFPLNKDGKAIDLETISVTPNSTLTSAPTYATSVPRLSPDVLDFSVISLGGEAGVIGSINPSFKEYQLGRDPRKLYSGKRMLTYETDVVMGTGASVGVDVGFGTFSNVKPFENPFERIIEASDADLVQSMVLLEVHTIQVMVLIVILPLGLDMVLEKKVDNFSIGLKMK